MAYGLIVAIVALAAGLILSNMNRQDPDQQDMSPNTIEAFKATTNNEGSVVPLVFGQARISANLLWYGNLTTEKVTEIVEGGKGGGDDQEVTTGYKYYMDVWECLCIGPDVSIITAYANDRELDAVPGTLNPGDTIFFPTEPGPYASPLTPLAHVWMDQQYLGENVSAIPTYHWVVQRDSENVLSHSNLSNGVNPAAIIYNLLLLGGATPSDIDTTTFQEAADYWYTKGYGVNLVVNKQEEVRALINRVFTWVDGNLRQNNNDKYELKVWTDSDTYDVEITDKSDFKNFSFRRRSWDDIYTDFRANYIDQDQEYTRRTIRVRNTAAQKIVGYPRQINVDLTGFRDVDTASERLWEIMKRYSYPEAQITCTVSMKYYEYRVGDVIRINHEDYGISDADFRLIAVDVARSDSNELGWTLTQLVSNLFDSNFVTSGSADWTSPDFTPQTLYDSEVFEVPYNPITLDAPAYLCLAARKGTETGFEVIYSVTGTDYKRKAFCTQFSQHGTLDEQYVSTTYTIDDDVGILYTPDRDDPEFSDLSRTDLFADTRIGILGGTEIIAFQTITPEGGSSFRLTGVIRGLFNTPVSTHNIGAEIWLTRISDNLLTGISASSFYLKFLPYFGGSVLDAGSATALPVTYAEKALTPWSPSNIKVVKSGSTNTVTVTNTTQIAFGAGRKAAENQPLVSGDVLDGTLQWYTSYDATINTETSRNFAVTRAGGFTLYVRQELNSRYSSYVSVVVGASDDSYYDSKNQLTNSGLERIDYGAQNWYEVMGRNSVRLNDELLKITGLVDVNDVGILDTQVLIWDAGTQTFIPEDYLEAFSTTTTTTTTSTTTTSSTTTSTTASTTSTTTTTVTASTTSTSSTTTTTSSTTTTTTV